MALPSESLIRLADSIFHAYPQACGFSCIPVGKLWTQGGPGLLSGRRVSGVRRGPHLVIVALVAVAAPASLPPCLLGTNGARWGVLRWRAVYTAFQV